MHGDKYAKVFDMCIKEMFLRVGEKTSPEEFAKQDEWYKKHCWTQEEENSFRQWMLALLRKKLRMNKKRAETEVAMFILNYGWTNKLPHEYKVIVQ